MSDHAGQTSAVAQARAGSRPAAAAATLVEVEAGWERAVETVLGDYLEAVCVEELERCGRLAARPQPGRVTLVKSGAGGQLRCDGYAGGACAWTRRDPAPLANVLTGAVARAGAAARAQRSSRGRFLITAGGEWVGRDWLRVTRGSDERAGVLEREHRLKGLRGSAACRARAGQRRRRLRSAAAREALRSKVSASARAQGPLQPRTAAHADLLAALQAGAGRAAESEQRGERLQRGRRRGGRERAATARGAARAPRDELARAQAALGRP